jgi:GAF domain-containing protein
MLANATRICEAKFGNLFLWEGDAFRAVAWHGDPTYVDHWRRESLIIPSDEPRIPLARLVETKQPVYVADLRAEPAYKRFAPLAMLIDSGGARTLLIVPMLKEHILVGAISIYRQEVRPFGDKQIELVQNFAKQAVIAIENTRLLTELRQRTDDLTESLEQQTATSEVLQVISSSPGELQPVFATMLENAVRICDAKWGTIHRWEGDALQLMATHNLPPAFAEARGRSPHATYGMSETMITAITDQRIGVGDAIGAATTQRKPIQVPDIRNEPTSPVNEIIVREGYRGILVIPLLRPDHIVGALVVRRKTPGEFANSTIDLLQTFADQSVVAIQNARLFESVEARTRELAKSLEDLRTAQDRLVQTQKLASLGQLTAGIAHEIKNPLNFVNNFSGVSVELIDEP